jgi:hypothetical protein
MFNKVTKMFNVFYSLLSDKKILILHEEIKVPSFLCFYNSLTATWE